MSTGKRLAKRSIVGTKVVVLREDGFYYPGIIQAVKTAEMDPAKGQSVSITKYAVRSIMDGGQQPGRHQLREYSEADLIGPGFQSTAGLTLKAGQRVYVTFTGREVAGCVTKHRPDVDQVHITLQVSNSNSVDIVKRMEEVRLMESRKSLRLMDQQHDVDFARLAEGGVVTSDAPVLHVPRKRGSSLSSSGIDVPGANSGTRKRRSSPNSNSVGGGGGGGVASSGNGATGTGNWHNGPADVIMDEDEDSDVMDECAAAMVLMRLSCSPHSPRWEELAAWQSSQSASSSSSGAFSWRGSVSSSSDSPPHAGAGAAGSSSSSSSARHHPVASGRKLKFRSATPSPPLVSGSAPAAFAGHGKFAAAQSPAAGSVKTDDGIASDESISECDESSPSGRSIIYQCTWPGCSTTTRSCRAIEQHVRLLHLGPRQVDDEISDHEEEFYYTEVEEEADEEPEVSHAPSAQQTAVAAAAAAAAAGGDQPVTGNAPAHPMQSSAFYQQHAGWMASSPPTLSHMDMARPPHEDPEYQRALLKARPIAIPARVRSISWSSGYGYGSNTLKQAKVLVSPGSSGGGSKTSPGNGAPSSASAASSSSSSSQGLPSAFTVKSSPIRRPRGEAKKCRKVYGMEHREQWCTQCKWKKACTRFGD